MHILTNKMTSYISKEMGIDMARWALKMIGKQGGVKVNSGIYDHNKDDLDDDDLRRKQIITLGTKDKPITVEDCLSFLKKLEKYGNNEVFDTGRSYCFEGIDINMRTKNYELYWGT